MKIAPSVLTADFANLENELASIKSADLLHLDIMDGHFVPNISFGSHVSKCIKKATKLPLDIHLMVTDPVEWIKDFSKANPEYITVHIESNDAHQALHLIKELGIKAGITLKPDTEIEAIKEYLYLVDLVLVMSVEPGFGGQAFMPSSLDKVRKLKELRKQMNFNFLIEIDGGVNGSNIDQVRDAGVDIAVVGSYIFNQENREKTIKDLKK